MPPPRAHPCPSLCPLAVADKLPGFELPFRLFMIFALLPLPLPPPYSVLCYVPSLWVFFIIPYIRREIPKRWYNKRERKQLNSLKIFSIIIALSIEALGSIENFNAL